MGEGEGADPDEGASAATVPPDDRARLADWLAAVRASCSELDTSAPSADWLMEVYGAAEALWAALPADMRDRAAAVILPAVARSPGGTPGVAGAEALVVIAGQLNRNGYSVRDELRPNAHVALGAFPAVAMFNHSCAPNCAVVTCPGGFLEVRTMCDVPPGVELTVSYVPSSIIC